MRKVLLFALCMLMLACAAYAENLYVSATSADGAWTSPLLAGQTYELCASGTYVYIGSLLADAEWNLQGEMSDEWAELSYYWPPTSYEQDTHDLIVDGMAVNWRGGAGWTEHTFSPDHIYKYYITGAGVPVHLAIADAYPLGDQGMYFYDNSGGLNVTVTAVPEPSSLMALGLGSIGMLGLLRRKNK
jgi:hypothetical protein